MGKPLYGPFSIFTNNIEIKCKELDEYQWLQSLTTKPKLRTYMEYKQTFGTEEYVKYCLSYSRKRRSLIAQTRIDILPLHIETGRFRNVKLENRQPVTFVRISFY